MRCAGLGRRRGDRPVPPRRIGSGSGPGRRRAPSLRWERQTCRPGDGRPTGILPAEDLHGALGQVAVRRRRQWEAGTAAAIEGSQSSGQGSRPWAVAAAAHAATDPGVATEPGPASRRPPSVCHRHLEHRLPEALRGPGPASRPGRRKRRSRLRGPDGDKPSGAERANSGLGDRGEDRAAIAASTALPPASAMAAPAALPAPRERLRLPGPSSSGYRGLPRRTTDSDSSA